MLEKGIMSKELLAEAIQGSTAKDLAIALGAWLSDVNVIVHDIQIFQSNNKWFAIVIHKLPKTLR